MEYETNPLKAIRKKCLDCCMGQVDEVKKCPIEDCELWHFRFGKNPYRTKKQLTEEQRQALVERLKKGKENVSRQSEPKGLEDS